MHPQQKPQTRHTCTQRSIKTDNTQTLKYENKKNQIYLNKVNINK